MKYFIYIVDWRWATPMNVNYVIQMVEPRKNNLVLFCLCLFFTWYDGFDAQILFHTWVHMSYSTSSTELTDTLLRAILKALLSSLCQPFKLIPRAPKARHNISNSKKYNSPRKSPQLYFLPQTLLSTPNLNLT